VPALDRRRDARSRAPVPPIIGHAHLAKVALAVERDVATKRTAADAVHTPIASAAPEVAASPT